MKVSKGAATVAEERKRGGIGVKAKKRGWNDENNACARAQASEEGEEEEEEEGHRRTKKGIPRLISNSLGEQSESERKRAAWLFRRRSAPRLLTIHKQM